MLNAECLGLRTVTARTESLGLSAFRSNPPTNQPPPGCHCERSVAIQPVAWMECNGIREHTSHQTPDSASCIRATGCYVAPSSTRCCCVQQASFDLEMELPSAPALGPFCDQLALLFSPSRATFPAFFSPPPTKSNILKHYGTARRFFMFQSVSLANSETRRAVFLN